MKKGFRDYKTIEGPVLRGEIPSRGDSNFNIKILGVSYE